jgi:hypothetical protein
MFFLQEEAKMISTGDKLVDENRYEPQADPAAMETEVQNPPKNKFLFKLKPQMVLLHILGDWRKKLFLLII